MTACQEIDVAHRPAKDRQDGHHWPCIDPRRREANTGRKIEFYATPVEGDLGIAEDIFEKTIEILCQTFCRRQAWATREICRI